MEDLNRWVEAINETMGKIKLNLSTLDEMKQKRFSCILSKFIIQRLTMSVISKKVATRKTILIKMVSQRKTEEKLCRKAFSLQITEFLLWF
jgi:hypothetical protein